MFRVNVSRGNQRLLVSLSLGLIILYLVYEDLTSPTPGWDVVNDDLSELRSRLKVAKVQRRARAESRAFDTHHVGHGHPKLDRSHMSEEEMLDILELELQNVPVRFLDENRETNYKGRHNKDCNLPKSVGMVPFMSL